MVPSPATRSRPDCILVSVLTPTFNEAENVQECAEEVRRVMESLPNEYDYEHLFVDNSSTDGTVDRLRDIAGSDERVKVVVNSRNVGPFRSTFNGLRSASGDVVVVMLAADLQDPPALIPEFLEKWRLGYRIVYGIRKNRPEVFWLRGARRIYYRMIARFSSVSVPLDAGEFQLVDRCVLENVLAVDDHYPYLRGLIAQTGFSSIGVPYSWGKRKHGKSKNNIVALIDQGLNGFVTTSRVLVRLALLAGTLVAGISVLYGLVQLVLAIFGVGTGFAGISTLIVTVLFLGGMQLLFLGVLGEYVVSIHSQVRREPPLIEVERINLPQESRRGPI